VKLKDIDWSLYDILQKFEPFGMKNPKPKYLAREVIIHELKPVGKDGSHLKIMVKHDDNRIRKTIGWRLCGDSGGIDWCKALKVGDTIDIVFELGVNVWNGNRELQLTIADLRKSI